MCNQLAWSCYSYEIALAPRLGLRLRARAGAASPQLRRHTGVPMGLTDHTDGAPGPGRWADAGTASMQVAQASPVGSAGGLSISSRGMTPIRPPRGIVE